MRRLCSTVLTMEALVLGLAIVPAVVLEHVNGRLAGAVGGSIVFVAIVLAGLVGRPRMPWVVYVGSMFQILVIAAGVVLPVMYFLGVIFAALWFTAIWLARKTEAAERDAPVSSRPGMRFNAEEKSAGGIANAAKPGNPIT